jgi:putative flippase GtrA
LNAISDESYQPGAMQALGLQFVLYLFVGGISSVLDIGGFAVLRYLSVQYLIASTLSFIAATILNYFLSYVLAFTRGKYSQQSEVVRFWLVSLVGLLINTAVVWMVVKALGAPPVAGKVIAVPVVLVWNFVGRRLFVFSKELPPAAMAIFSRSNEAERRAS